MFNAPNPDTEPSTAFVAPAEMPLHLEKALVENNRDFSTELLRLALGGIAVIGVIYDKIINHLPGISRLCVGISVFCFGVAAAGALFHRLLNNVSLRRYVWGLRFHEASKATGSTDANTMIAKSKECLTERDDYLKWATRSKAVSASLLSVGAVVLAVGFVVGLWTARDSSTQQPTPVPTFPSRIDVHVDGLQRSAPANANPPHQ
jgi:hypothetical protein